MAAATEPAPLPAGTRLGPVVLGHVLHAGASGIVYEAWEPELDRLVAVKEHLPQALARRDMGLQVVPRSAAEAPAFADGLRQFENQSRRLMRLRAPALPTVHAVQAAHGTAYRTMQLVRGRTLAELATGGGESRSAQGWWTLLERLLAALEALHAAGLLHLGISPHTIVIEDDGLPMLLGFGGTAGLSALDRQSPPAAQPVGPWTDLDALGAALQAVSSERLPGPDPTFRDAIDWMLARRPGGRPQSVAELRAALPRLGLPPPGPPAAPLGRDPVGEPASPLGSVFEGLLDGTFGVVRPAARPAAATAGQALSEPLRFGLTAPRQAAAGAEFVVSFAAYVESRRQQALTLARALVGPKARQVADMPADGPAAWRPGTPFSVRLSGRSFEIAQPEQRFRWNGSHHVLGFAVLMDPTARVSAVLTAMVMVEGIVVASVPVQIGVADPRQARRTAGADLTQAIRPAPTSAFASYASADAAQVAGRLSSLTRHAPDLRIFQDCLDLAPGEAYKPRLRDEIALRDVFWLFWSRNASASSWVRWELDTALACKDEDDIVPMPLEDPALAPPPEPLAHHHFRDRFMIAGLALARAAGRDHLA